MKFVIQKFNHESHEPPGIYIELDPIADMATLFKEGYIRLPIMNDGEVAQHVTLYLKGRGISADRLDKEE